MYTYVYICITIYSHIVHKASTEFMYFIAADDSTFVSDDQVAVLINKAFLQSDELY